MTNWTKNKKLDKEQKIGENQEENQEEAHGMDLYPGVTGIQEVSSVEMDNDTEEAQDDTRVHTVTKSGRKVRFREDLYRNYAFTQASSDGNVLSPSGHTPSLQLAFGMSSSAKVARRESPADDNVIGHAFTQYSLKQALRRFPKEAQAATMAEMQQLHDMQVFQPVPKDSLTKQEHLEVLRSIIFIKQKRCGRVKARVCADGRPQRYLYKKWEASSPTVKTESVLLTSLIEAKEKRTVGVYDIPGAFLHSKLEETVHMKVSGVLAKCLIEVSKETYGPFVSTENGQTTIYLLLTRALYGCLKSALQFWKHLSGHLKNRGFEQNPYNPCVANKIVNGNQLTVVWHVDDLKISHVDEAVVDNEVKWLESIYGPLSGSKGLQHTYLGMDLDFSGGELKVSMVPYLQELVDEFPDKISSPASTPATVHLFEEVVDPVLLDKEKAKVFHHIVAKALWAALCAHPDLLTTLSFLTCKVKAPDKDDYKKLTQMISYIKGTIDLPLKLSADRTSIVKWWVDASYATRKDMRSQTGGTMSLGKGSIYSMSQKQKLNMTSSTKAELVAADDVMPQIIWTRYFLQGQGVKVSHNVLHQDNQSAILLEKNGVSSSSKRT